MVRAKSIKPTMSAAELKQLQERNAPAGDGDDGELQRMREARGNLTAQKGTPVEHLSPTAPPPTELVEHVASLPEVAQSVEIHLWDGRVIEMGPPTIPHQLVIPKMFSDQEARGFQLEVEVRMAKIFQYVRRINDQRLPGALMTWAEVTRLAHELGEFGVRAVYECYEENWPDFGARVWSEVKKRVSIPSSAK